MKALLVLLAILFTSASNFAQTPEWIWFKKTDAAETRYFRKVFNLDSAPTKADLMGTADDSLTIFINGEKVLSGEEWQRSHRADVKSRLKTGRNLIAIRAINGDSSPAGALAQLAITTGSGKQTIVTDASWKAEERELADWSKVSFDDASWAAASSLGKLGIAPWGDISAAPAAAAQRVKEATPADQLYVLNDFKVELVMSGGAEDGSWVNLCKDDKGRLIVSPQYRSQNPEGGLLRLTLSADGKVEKREFIAKPLYDAQGMVFANGALWVVVNKYSTKFESGLYRITDDGSDSWSKIELIKILPGGGEHGPHAVELGPDGNLWVMAGNHTRPPEGLSPASPHKNYQEDHMLPRQPDGNGHATGVMAPGGYICKVSPDGKNWELFCGGFRNQFDFTFNPDGELFVFDADMEWDWGMPWYRPTRVNHATSGAEFGWRYGTGKWPDYYADSLGAAVDIGLGCPTGVANGKGAKFPAKYQKAIYLMDWTFGRLMAVHLQPDGASYKGTFENFVAPAGLVDRTKGKPPLNLTDMIVGPDGAMYFTTGGRETAAGLYRVTYTGKESTTPDWTANKSGAEERELRRKLEAFHGKSDAKALSTIWPHLNSADRAIRYAARIALESQPVDQWKDRAFQENAADAGITAMLALARVGGKPVQEQVWKSLGKWPLKTLSERQQLDKLRVVQVSIARHGLPSVEVVSMATEKLTANYPNPSAWINREISQVLIALRAAGVVGKTLQLLASASTQEERLHYLFHLRTAKNWTAEQRREYFDYWTTDRKNWGHDPQVLKWFDEAGRPYADGASFNNFLKNFLKEAGENLQESDKAEFEPLLANIAAGKAARREVSAFPAPTQRGFVKSWTMAELASDLEKAGSGRNFKRGQQAFVDAQCLACHRMGSEGGGVGPDLTAISTRFKRTDMLESVLDPSKVLSEQYEHTTVVLKDGDDHTGRLVDETAEQIVLVPNQLQPENKVTIKKNEIASRRASKISPMPAGLADMLTKEELLDLVAFMESGGRPSHPAFGKQ